MSESTARRSSRERYQFTWSISTEGSQSHAVESHVAEPMQVAVELAPESLPQEPVDELVGAMEAEDEEARAPPVDEGTWKIFQTSPKSRGRTGPASAGLPMKVRLGAVAGWSCLAAVGAVLMVMNPGTILTLRLAALGAAWAGISAAIWVLPAKLK